MNKEKKVFVGCVLLLVLTLVTVYAVSGTYAKYASSVTGTGSARVAKWAWNINGTDLANGTKTFALNLFDTVNDTDGATAEGDVATADDAKIIAPGTSGKFAISVKNNSEVTAHYKYTLSAENGGIPIQYSLDGTTWKDDIGSLSAEKELKANATAESMTIYWRWVYETDNKDTDDVTDTALGFAATAKVNVTAKLDFTQVD